MEAVETNKENLIDINLKILLESGSHYGTKTSEWHPVMRKFIFGIKNGIHIIDLEKTIRQWNITVRPAVVQAASEGKVFLFVCTKKQAKEQFTTNAINCKSPYVNERWRAGLLTNFKVNMGSVSHLVKLEETLRQYENHELKYTTKQEAGKIKKEIDKLDKDLHGIRELKELPDFLFVIDALHDNLAVAEARKLGIPIVALVDTNVNPNTIDYPIPANDDAVKSITLFSKAMSEAINEGYAIYEANKPTEAPKQSEEELEKTGGVEENLPVAQFTDSTGKEVAIQVEKVKNKANRRANRE